MPPAMTRCSWLMLPQCMCTLGLNNIHRLTFRLCCLNNIGRMNILAEYKYRFLYTSRQYSQILSLLPACRLSYNTCLIEGHNCTCCRQAPCIHTVQCQACIQHRLVWML
ncbi:MAG: helix-turn-helix domain-containing protein [Candidatus Aenigmarchaeota archaeon]|nr:helix-turn-helix domain-containing protein [Candidatus Aenigmarchaeota archaeon]